MTKTMGAVIGSVLLLAAGAASASDTGLAHIWMVKAWPGFVHLVLDKDSPCGTDPGNHYVIVDPASKEHIVSLAYSAWASGRAVNIRFDCKPPGVSDPDVGAGDRNVVKGIRAIY